MALSLDPEVFEHRNAYGTLLQERTVAEKARFHYYLAKTYANAGNNERAIQYIRMALEEGFKERQKLMEEPEFAKLRETDAFKELMAYRATRIVRRRSLALLCAARRLLAKRTCRPRSVAGSAVRQPDRRSGARLDEPWRSPRRRRSNRRRFRSRLTPYRPKSVSAPSPAAPRGSSTDTSHSQPGDSACTPISKTPVAGKFARSAECDWPRRQPACRHSPTLSRTSSTRKPARVYQEQRGARGLHRRDRTLPNPAAPAIAFARHCRRS